ncbi:diacylglycerol/lipid kinase family protein [Lactovum miscens]|uniref:YegS/Rv2252/BmrU family lipid kinase n=1 Tax=Lactovum miscens TaxID=190387 RepID=A0A841CAT4_9LACT|nr:diacylglycerol kinase family protein [Lactovum miscens]MBB5888672.1 YegS/Rv2252/BmrU family lipid kinase [Lactovum miscens]
MTYYLLANPNSGNLRGSDKILKLINYLENTAIQFKLFETSAPGQERNLISKILNKMNPQDQIVIIGGDGTLSLCMDVLPAKHPFAYIPTGSGNDFARSLGISMDPIKAFKSIQLKNEVEFFVIGYDSTDLKGFAVNNIGIGLDGAIINAANSSKSKTLLNKIRLGQLTYLFAALGVLFKKKGFSVRINEKEFDNAFLFTLTKHPYFGGGVKIAPNASNLNDLINLIEVDRIPQVQIFSLLTKLARSVHLKDPRFHNSTSNQFSITLASDEPVQIDGEAYQISTGSKLHVWTEKRTIIK